MRLLQPLLDVMARRDPAAFVAMALRDEQISDFPLCNKSFNLSYAGNDL